MVRAYYMQMRWDMALGDAEKHDLLQLNMYISISMITWHFDTMIRIQKWKVENYGTYLKIEFEME